MRHLVHSQLSMLCLIKQRGQALVELAAFGTVLLLCLAMLIQYGMQANYQQNMYMQAFRKTMEIAHYKSGPSASAAFTMLHDKPIPDPRDPWGFAERVPIGGGGSVTWDSNLQAIYIDEYDFSQLDNADLSRNIIEINDTLALPGAKLSDAGIRTIDSTDGAFTTAAYNQEDPCSGWTYLALENPDRLSQSEEYTSIRRRCNQIYVMRDEDGAKPYAVIRNDGLKHKLSLADVDDDGKLEPIIAVRGSMGLDVGGDQICDADNFCGTLAGIIYIDYQEGEMDTDYTIIHPWEEDKDVDGDGRLAEHLQGLALDYSVAKFNANTMVRREGSTGSNDWVDTDTTFSNSAYQETTHLIDRRGGAITYHTQFRPESFDSTWGAATK